MKHYYLVLFFLCGAGLLSVSAQKISSQKGLTTATFNVPAGIIKVYLPDDIRPGDLISGRIIANPVGKNKKQVEKNLAELKKYSIGFNNEKFAVANNSIRSLIQPDRPVSGDMKFTISVSTLKGEVVEVKVPQAVQNPALADCGIPTHALANAPLTIPGKFDGDAGNTQCSLNNKPLEILAESPRQCIISFPADAKGTQTLSVQEKGGQFCTKNVAAVIMNIKAGKLNLLKGEQTFIDVKITGLQNLTDTAVLSLVNITPDIVSMQPLNSISIPLVPDSVGAGIYERRFMIQSNQTGSFMVNVDLDLPGAASPIYADVPKLDKPRKLDEKALQIGLHVAIKKLEADAGGANGKEFNTACDNCKHCIKEVMGKWAEELIKKLGDIVLDEYLGKAFDAIISVSERLKQLKEFMDKVDKKIDNAKDLAKELEDMVKAGDLQFMAIAPQICGYCSIHGSIFYNPKTGCVFAILYCEGTKLCCDNVQTIFKITYCTDDHGQPIGMPGVEVIKN